MTTPQQIAENQASLDVPINENNAALGQAFLWAHDVEADTGLTVGLAGGVFDGNTVAAATLACTNNTTNYIVAQRSTRTASVSTATLARMMRLRSNRSPSGASRPVSACTITSTPVPPTRCIASTSMPTPSKTLWIFGMQSGKGVVGP